MAAAGRVLVNVSFLLLVFSPPSSRAGSLSLSLFLWVIPRVWDERPVWTNNDVTNEDRRGVAWLRSVARGRFHAVRP